MKCLRSICIANASEYVCKYNNTYTIKHFVVAIYTVAEIGLCETAVQTVEIF